MSTKQMLFSGFGGQGILFSGKFIAYKGLMEDKQVSWLPSYGPEMRGGTASCSVIVSDEPVGSPIVSNPDTENEKTESVQVAKGLQVAFSADYFVEESFTLYADAACTQTFEGEWDVNTDITIYVKWGE